MNSNPHSSGASLGELAVRFGCTLRGDPDIRVQRIASIQEAGEGELTFLTSRKFQTFLSSTRASAVVLDAKAAERCSVATLVANNPHVLFARIANFLHASPAPISGVHASATVHPTAKVDATADIGANCVIGANANIGARVVIGPGSVVLNDAIIGNDTRLIANVTVCERVVIGERCIVHPSAVIGADGFGFANDAGIWIKVPQVGTVRIGNDVEIGAGTTIDRGAIGDTVLEEGVKLDNQIQIGHNVHVGAHTAMAAGVGISGSATIGKHCMIGGMVGIAGWLTICDRVVITGKTMVSSSIKEPGTYSGMLPFDTARRFRRNAARFKKLEAQAKLRALNDEAQDTDGVEDEAE